ncbi:MAG: cold shock domain-containing protein [Rhodospirillaceae bacterium]|nr:cold shock domain-containing protein [Rhodospirillaceae bacterium]MYB12115.1 cold shock domain-containing protein [Rhodospirillaceae bacterium]MYI48372.1 cold shock domain-containing protein [Rhodospirillaceae bacterium]
MDLSATIKFFNPVRGFGFVVPDAGDREVFVHASVPFRSGMADLAPSQRAFVRAESIPRRLQATDKEPIRTEPTPTGYGE